MEYEKFLCTLVPDTIFCTLFYIFFLILRDFKKFSVPEERQTLIFPTVKNYLASYPCLLQEKTSYAIADNRPGKKV